MIQNISIQRGDKDQFFSVGGKLISNDKETDTTVEAISVLFGRVKIKFSDGATLILKGFPYSYAKTNLWRRSNLQKGEK